MQIVIGDISQKMCLLIQRHLLKQLTFIGAIVLFQRIEPGFYSVLFYHIVLKSDFGSEQAANVTEHAGKIPVFL
jgi:hypothetical protein